jgi:hypothetical protein
MPNGRNGFDHEINQPGVHIPDVHDLPLRQGHQQVELHQQIQRQLQTEATTVSVTTYAKLEDALDETKVNPPRRRSLRTDTTGEGSRGKSGRGRTPDGWQERR